MAWSSWTSNPPALGSPKLRTPANPPGARSLAGPRSPEDKLEELDAVFSALAHRARRQILMALRFRGGSMNAGDIAGRFAHAWPTTTRHLRVLEDAGLVTHEREGTGRTYRIAPGKVRVIAEWIAWFDERKAARKDRT
jgi:DNA-binding transcriptional ArsR family regulator